MESKAKYLLVGILVSVFTIAAVVFILWVAEVGSRRSVDFYTIYFREHSLSGLQVDSVVTMKGIKVGAVSEFRISPKNVEEVRVDVRVQQGTPVKRDTRAIIKRNLLTGLATVELTGGSQETSLLSEVLPNERFPVIQEGKTELEQIADSLPGLIEDAGELLSRAKSIVSNENIRRVNQSVANVEEFTAALAAQAEPLGKLVKDLNAVAEDLKRVSASVKKASDTTGRQVEKLSAEMSVTLQQITKTAAQLEKDSRQLGTVTSRGITRLVLEVANTAEDISNAARTFTSTVEQFEDPRALLVGPSDQALGPGESRR